MLTESILAIFEQGAEPLPENPAASLPQESSQSAADVCASRVLLHLGIPPHVQGYKYLRQAVLLTLDNPMVLDNLTHSLYPAIAYQLGSTAPRVERSIRHAIDMAWSKHGAEPFRQLLPRSSQYLMDCPTVREFLALVTERVRIHLMHRG